MLRTVDNEERLENKDTVVPPAALRCSMAAIGTFRAASFGQIKTTSAIYKTLLIVLGAMVGGVAIALRRERARETPPRHHS